MIPGHGLFDLYKEQAQALAGARKPLIENAKTSEEKAKLQMDAQMEQGIATDATISRAFGETVNKVSFSGLAKPLVVKQTPKCPKCGNANISRFTVASAGNTREQVEECGRCDWSQRTPKQ